MLRMKLVGSNAKTHVIGQDELPGKSNYFIGNDPKKWHTGVRQFAKVRYGDVYPGVDLVYYGHQRELEYDFVLKPGADPQAIRLGIRGAKRLRLEHGDLVLTSGGGDVHLRSPQIYQEANGARQKIHGEYVIKGRNEVGFRVAAYDRRRALVIDPVLAYSTYLGGSFDDSGHGIAVDSAGNAYVAGSTDSTDFPTTPGAFQVTCGASCFFVTKLDSDGSALVYSTYIGPISGPTVGEVSGVAVDAHGNAYVTGYTSSTDFPLVNPIQPIYGGGNFDAFVTEINAAGSALVYSTYLGGAGEERSYGIAVGATGNAYVTGVTSSTDFPLVNPIQSTYGGSIWDAFVTKINPAGSAWVYSTYLGGSSDDYGNGISVDSAGNAYVAGSTQSSDFPTTPGAYQTTCAPCDQAFVTKLNAYGSRLVYSTYLGGSNGGGGAQSIAVDATGNAYVTGSTTSTDFPLVNPIQSTIGGIYDAFVTKFNAAGTALAYSTYVGGNAGDEGCGIAVDTTGNAIVLGNTTSTNFPVANAIQPTNHGKDDAFLTKINAGGTLLYSTYLGGGGNDYCGGIATDMAGTAYATGTTFSKNFPKTVLAFQPSLKGTNDAFVSKIASQTFLSISPSKYLTFPTQVIGTTSAAKKVTMTNNGSGTLTINKIYIAGLNPSDFGETNTCVGTLAPNTSCTIFVTFTPTDKNKRQALMVISDSDPTSPQSIALSGNGTVVSFSKNSLSFGNQQVGTSSAPESVILTNVGNTQVYFFGISITGTNPGDFSETNTCGTSIGAKASCTITVTFKPTATGSRTAAVSISDDGGGSPQNVHLTGTGT